METQKTRLCTLNNTLLLLYVGVYDVIHFNFGLHDLVDAGPGEGQEHVDLDAYGANIAEIYRRLKPRAKHVRCQPLCIAGCCMHRWLPPAPPAPFVTAGWHQWDGSFSPDAIIARAPTGRLDDNDPLPKCDHLNGED